MLDRIIRLLALLPPCRRSNPLQHFPCLLRMHVNLQLAHLFTLPHDRLPHIRLDRMTLEHRHGRGNGDRQIETRQSAGLDAADVSDLEQLAAVDERLDDPFEARAVLVGDALVEQFQE